MSRYGRLFDDSLYSTVMKKVQPGNGESVPTHQLAHEALIKLGLSVGDAAAKLHELTGSEILALSQSSADELEDTGHALAKMVLS